jgi:hypothetical protein
MKAFRHNDADARDGFSKFEHEQEHKHEYE